VSETTKLKIVPAFPTKVTKVTTTFLDARKGTQIRWADYEIWIVASICNLRLEGRRWVVWPPIAFEHLAHSRYGEQHPDFATSEEAFEAYRILSSLAEDTLTTLQVNDRTTT
jgi:hypothetical protein